MLDRETALAMLRDALAACDPARRVAAAMTSPEVARRLAGRDVVGLAMGKAAIAMARGAGKVARGIAVAPASLPGHPPIVAADLPDGWQLMLSTHPEPDERSLEAGEAVIELVRGAKKSEVVLALVSGGASALVEKPLPPVTLDELRAVSHTVIAAGAPIAEINAVRSALSSVKAGRLARMCPTSIVTLAASDVIGDELGVIGSGATVGSWIGKDDTVDLGVELTARRARARAIVDRYVATPPASVDEVLDTPRETSAQIVARSDHAEVIAGIASFAEAALTALAARKINAALQDAPMQGDVAQVASQLADFTIPGPEVMVAWGEPTVRVPANPGDGGRAQQLALLLAKALRGTTRSALVVGSDGIDGPPPKSGRPSPAGAFVDGATWDKIVAAGVDPEAALAKCDAGTALDRAGALVITGVTGVNHADLIVIG
jgi:glycerate 2-kinase